MGARKQPVLITVLDHVAWSYANLARAHAALEDSAASYTPKHYMIRNRIFSGLRSGKMSMRSLYDDERLKLLLPVCCAYCGSCNHLSLDHLIPRARWGGDDGANLVYACRSCNSSKQARDLLSWMQSNGRFPSIYVLRRYLKLAAARLDQLDMWNEEFSDALRRDLPFALGLIPTKFPPLSDLRLWVAVKEPELSARSEQ